MGEGKDEGLRTSSGHPAGRCKRATMKGANCRGSVILPKHFWRRVTAQLVMAGAGVHILASPSTAF